MIYEVTYPLMCTEREAKDVIKRMQEEIDKKGYVTVKNMYDMVWMLPEHRGKMDHAFGWTNLRMADVEYNVCKHCYEVLLPVPVAL